MSDEHKRQQENMNNLPPLALYIHFPWCIKKCPYCDFNSHQVGQGGFPEMDYLSALIFDLKHSLKIIDERCIEHIFLGGGTPSLFSAKIIGLLMEELFSSTLVSSAAEITMEVNPGAAETLKLRDFRSSGINRLSIGAQSFNTKHLKQLGRVHSGKDVLRAIDSANDIFQNVNVDIMYALPNQTIQDLEEDVNQLIKTDVHHVSLYQLTIEPKTVFWRKPPALPDDDISERMENLIKDKIGQHGYMQYEIAAFAKKGFESHHNKNYWCFGDYLGIGAGAHSKISDNKGVTRIEKKKSPQKYMDGAKNYKVISRDHRISPEDLPGEFMMNALRLKRGFNVGLFTQRTGLDIKAILPAIEKGKQLGFLSLSEGNLKPTDLGYRFLNNLIQLFIPD